MSQWKQIQQLDARLLEHVDYLYDDNFPMDIRQCLATWIESQDWDAAANDQSMATVLFSNLLSQVDVVRSHEQNFLQKHNMKIIQQQLQVKYTNNPALVAQVISNYLREERRILSNACMKEQGPLETSLQDPVAFERQKNTDNRVGVIRGSVQLVDQAVKYIEDMQEDFDFRFNTLQSRDGDPEKMKEEVIKLQEMLNRLDFKRKEILSKMDVVVKEIDDVIASHLSPELLDWKRRQQIAAIGGPLLAPLDQLQNWFTLTAQSLFQVKRQLDKLGDLAVKVTYECDPIPLQKPQLEERVKYLLYHLIRSSFVVEKQPCMATQPQKPLIIKTGVQFATKVRLLVKLPEVDYQLRVKTTFDKDLPPGRVSRQFHIVTHNTKVMDIEDYSSGCLSVTFRHLQLKEKKSSNSSTKGNEGLLFVTEELHSLGFEARFTVQGLSVDLETCSLPLVVISNVCQLPGGWASVMWYNLLTDEPRNLAFFCSPPRACWRQLSEVLNWQFSSFSDQGLKKEQLLMLGEKLLGQRAPSSDSLVSWSRFSRENIPGKPFTFWMWLDSILDLIKKHLLTVWNENYIMGFVSKEVERLLLKDRESGTFLLRFSESHLGGITFTWVERSNSEVKLNSVEPYTKNRLSALPFADIIRHYKVISEGVVPENPLKFLYPDIPKDEAFGRLYNSEPSKVYPYISFSWMPISEMRSSPSSTPLSCPSPEPSMTPGEFDMLSDHMCFDLDTVVHLTPHERHILGNHVVSLGVAGSVLKLTGVLLPVCPWMTNSLRMTRWQELLRLDSASQGRVRLLYEDRFLLEIRQSLSAAVESLDWDSAAAHEDRAAGCFRALAADLEEQRRRSVRENTVLQGPDFTGMGDYLLKTFEGQPMTLAAILSEGLKKEQEILASAYEAQGRSRPVVERKRTPTDDKVNELKSRFSEVKKELKLLEGRNEKLTYIQETLQSQVKQHVELAPAHAAVEESCLNQANTITVTERKVLQWTWQVLKLAEDITATLLEEALPDWKRRQQAACIGSPADTCSVQLQKWFTAVAEVLLGVHEQMQKRQNQNQNGGSDASSLSVLAAEIEGFNRTLFTKLLANALVVEKQPTMSSQPQRPLILKTGAPFDVAVRFLANLPTFKYLLSVKPVFDKDVEEVQTIKGRNCCRSRFRCFVFTRDASKVLDEDEPGGGLVAEFSHMDVGVSPGPFVLRQNRLLVTEELHVMKFVTEFRYAGLRCSIEVSSLPVVVITAHSQVDAAWASILWSNALSAGEPRNLSLFLDPPPLAWQQLAQVLRWQFLTVSRRELDGNQLSMLRQKFVDGSADVVLWSKFSKKESAWFWLSGVLDMIRLHLVDLWRDGLIMGFVSRASTKALLQERQAGNFLLRFSESSRDGAISISWVDRPNGEVRVHSVEPYTKQELAFMRLVDILYLPSLEAQRPSEGNPLLYLYPDTPKDAVFKRYRKTPATPTSVNGYVMRDRKLLLPNPSPPPSPPSEDGGADMEVDADQSTEKQQQLKEIVSDLLEMDTFPDLNVVLPDLPQILGNNVGPGSSSTCLNQSLV
ncbi:signal transducer and activator of transcription 4 [Brachionichthys hirsutus]|uniref:signal transducer and activator of transcription 4 n=1 Tax=Brachionichthys hirsutus TaxID=412623 RepID=UPI003604611C